MIYKSIVILSLLLPPTVNLSKIRPSPGQAKTGLSGEAVLIDSKVSFGNQKKVVLTIRIDRSKYETQNVRLRQVWSNVNDCMYSIWEFQILKLECIQHNCTNISYQNCCKWRLFSQILLNVSILHSTLMGTTLQSRIVYPPQRQVSLYIV